MLKSHSVQSIAPYPQRTNFFVEWGTLVHAQTEKIKKFFIGVFLGGSPRKKIKNKKK